MESIEFKNLKEISKNKIKKVLLINCKRKGYIPTSMPHVGLGILSGILKKRGSLFASPCTQIRANWEIAEHPAGRGWALQEVLWERMTQQCTAWART